MGCGDRCAVKGNAVAYRASVRDAVRATKGVRCGVAVTVDAVWGGSETGSSVVGTKEGGGCAVRDAKKVVEDVQCEFRCAARLPVHLPTKDQSCR